MIPDMATDDLHAGIKGILIRQYNLMFAYVSEHKNSYLVTVNLLMSIYTLILFFFFLKYEKKIVETAYFDTYMQSCQ